MQRMTPKNWLAVCLLVASSEWAAAQSGMASLRVRCDGDSTGAAVSINGQFKGECPFDAMVPEGTLKLEARKSLGKEHERLFVQEMRVGAGIIKSIEVVLGREQLTAEGKRAREVQAEAERREQQARQAEQQRQSAEAERQRAVKFERLRNAAESGDAEAMASLADVLDAGQNGLPADQGQALIWYQKVAEAGNPEAMFLLSEKLEKAGKSTAHAWLRKAAQAGHRGAEERLDRLPRYCQAQAFQKSFLSGSLVYSPGFEDMQADGTEKPVKAALERYAQQLKRLQPGTWDTTLSRASLACLPARNEHLGNGLVCSMFSSGEQSVGVVCGNGESHREQMRFLEDEARKNGGSVRGSKVLFEWNGQ